MTDQLEPTGGGSALAPAMIAPPHRRTSVEIAREWRGLVLPDYPWKAHANQAGATASRPEGGGLMVTCDAIHGRRAYMKPKKRDLDPAKARAAREKIASDLAYDLGVAVPPVVLANRQADAEERHVMVSLVLHRAQFSWLEVKRLVHQLGDERATLVRSTFSTAAARGFAFDVWLDQTDHSDMHPDNIIVGFDPANLEDRALVFLDYAMALGWGGRWAEKGYEKPSHPAFPPVLLDYARGDRQELVRMVEAIENFPQSTISDVVDRIPDTHLTNEQREIIVTGLTARRGVVRSVLNRYIVEER